MENNSVPKPPATATKYMYIYTYTNINKSYPQAEGASIMRYPVDRTCCMQHAIHPEVITTPPLPFLPQGVRSRSSASPPTPEEALLAAMRGKDSPGEWGDGGLEGLGTGGCRTVMNKNPRRDEHEWAEANLSGHGKNLLSSYQELFRWKDGSP